MLSKKYLSYACISQLLLALPAFSMDLSEQAMNNFKQAKYAQAATAFAKSYAGSHKATDCYYTALSYHYANNSELARKFYQETIQQFPNSHEASLARQALASPERSMTTTRVNPRTTSSSYSSPQTIATSAPAGDSVDDLLAKAEAADLANQSSTADSYYSDAIRNAEKLGQNNPKLIAALEQAAKYNAKHERTDRALALYDRQRNLLKYRHGEDSVQCGNNLLAIARMYKNANHVDDAKSHYYGAIDTYTNALQDAESRSQNSATQPRALLASTLDELADYIYNLAYSVKGYGNIDTGTQHSTDLEVSKLRTRAERVRAGN